MFRIPPHHAGIAQLVERNLAKVEVASSILVSRSNSHRAPRKRGVFVVTQAEWQSGYAAACKAVYLGSIPGSASIFFPSDRFRLACRRYAHVGRFYIEHSSGSERYG